MKATTAEQVIDLIKPHDQSFTSLMMLETAFIREAPNGLFYLSNRHEGIMTDIEEIESIIDGLIKFYDQIQPEAFEDIRYKRHLAAQERNNDPPREKPQKRITPGYVYLLESDGAYKIGLTRKGVQSRVAQIQRGLPHPLEIVHVIPCDNPEVIEATLHQIFGRNRLNGEWFSLSADDVAYIKSLGGES